MDLVSIILGFVVCTVWYKFRVRRIIKNAESRFSAARADAALERLQAYRHYKTYDAIKSGERDADEPGLTPIEELLPWEDDQYGYVYLGQPVHTDVHIQTNYGVILKDFGIRMIIEETYYCETSQRNHLYWTADADFKKVKYVGFLRWNHLKKVSRGSNTQGSVRKGTYWEGLLSPR